MIDIGQKSIVLRCRNLEKRFKLPTGVIFKIANLDLELFTGEIVRLAGKSGSGKSTLLRLLGLLAIPDRGSIEICGIAPSTWVARDRIRAQKIGIVFQEGNLIGHLSLMDNLKIARISKKDLYLNLSEQFGLQDVMKTRANRLSGGELQRAGICRALINNPAILLMDEPTSALDDDMTKELIRVVKDAQHSGVAILIASHDQRLDGIENRRLEMVCGKVF